MSPPFQNAHNGEAHKCHDENRNEKVENSVEDSNEAANRFAGPLLQVHANSVLNKTGGCFVGKIVYKANRPDDDENHTQVDSAQFGFVKDWKDYLQVSLQIPKCRDQTNFRFVWLDASPCPTVPN